PTPPPPRPPTPRSGAERAQHIRPFTFGRGDDALRIGGKRRHPGAVIEQEQPHAGNQPHARVSSNRDAVRDAERVIAAELRHVDVGPRREGLAIAAVAEAPDRAAVTEFDVWTAEDRLAVGIEGDRVVAPDGKT